MTLKGRCIQLSFWGVERATLSLTTTTKILSYVINKVQRIDKQRLQSRLLKITLRLLRNY